ncbi:uncharacterized protein isoform X3 [Takifugu rubripes]|uniref:uncharacterized protein isoform X3 n=1 Tax=Takifugu rubripes TaxID=31033 RepID=UPI001145EA0D|nr:uncharacterized protein LOC105417539 isoform X3 [Takifugu rubripes]
MMFLNVAVVGFLCLLKFVSTTSADDPWWLYLIAAAASVVLTIGCLTVFIYKRRKGTGQNEENICYTSVIYQSTNGGAQVIPM